MIVSGGCSIISLLSHEHVKSIDSFDMNPSQIFLAQLRLAALKNLPPQKHKHFVGGFPDIVDNQERLEIYESLRNELPKDCRGWWDRNTYLIRTGINQCGRFEYLFYELQMELLKHSFVLSPENCDISNPVWRNIFEKVFARKRLIHMFGEEAVNYSMEKSFAQHFCEVFSQAVKTWPDITQNYFLNQVLGNKYSLTSYPTYLEDENYYRLQKRLHNPDFNLNFFLGDFWKYKEQAERERTYDVVHTSNISDWMPIPSLRQILQDVKKKINPGGAIIMRRLNGDHNLESIVKDYFHVDKDLNKSLKSNDKSFFYSEVVVGFNGVPS
eukprot:TRINITY_DN373_c0_g1_i1.p2 TRINITY_DN373_c0_g1~~TRINITY_DN373_c0_g1_i1.p2  ORF type:complete len:326 (-),score=36.92 TRINITY_DN373_c0_g1_i1:73-1050(-)